jgi:hypothetical protein
MPNQLITTAQLAALLGYTPGTIRNKLKDSVLIEGVHYYRPFGRRKTLYDWPVIERDMKVHSRTNSLAMKPANAGKANRG